MYPKSFLSLSFLGECLAIDVFASVLVIVGRLVVDYRSHSCNAADNAIKTDCDITIHLATFKLSLCLYSSSSLSFEPYSSFSFPACEDRSAVAFFRSSAAKVAVSDV